MRKTNGVADCLPHFHVHKRLFLIFTAMLAGVLLMTVFSSAKPAWADDTEVFKLSNGLTVVLHRDTRFPLVSMRFYVHAGSAYETPKEAGISHLLEHMVFKGTHKRPKGGIAEAIEGIGGYLNAATSFDYTVYITDLPAKQWKTGLDVLHDQAFNSIIDEKELESEKKVVIAELKRGEDSPGGRLFKQLQTSALAGTPYQHPIIGYEDVINQISRQDILDYINRFYQPQSTMLLISGDIDKEAVKREIERLYGDLQNSRPVRRPEIVNPASLPSDGPFVSVERGPWNKVYLGVAFPSVSQQDARTVPLDVLSALLGEGKTSYFHRKYKYDRQLVDSISVSNYSFERAGLLYFNVVLDADKLDEFWPLFVRDLRDIDKIAFTEQELERVKLNLEDSLYRSKETLPGLASKLGFFHFFDNGAVGEDNYIYAIRKTSLEDLKGLLADLLVPQRMSVAALLPAEKGASALDRSADAAGETTPAVKAAVKLAETLEKEWPAAPLPPRAEDKAVSAGEKEIIELDRGRKLILIPDATLPYISASLMFSGGDALLDKNEEGLAAATAALLPKGAGQFSATQIEDYLADRASSLNASAGHQSFTFNLSGPERFSADLFKLLRLVIDEPALKADELTRVKNNQISAIKSAEDQPFSLATRRIFPFLFGDHPYGYLTLGTPESVSGFTPEKARDFWSRQKSEPWVLAVTGSFDRESVIAAAKTLPIPSGSGVEIGAPNWTAEKALTLKLPGRHQYHLMLIFPTVPIADQDAPAVNLLQSVLSGQSGLLFSELRDKQGLGYTVTAIPWNSRQAGALIFYIGTEPEKADQAKAGFLQVIDRLRNEELPEAELQRGKNSIEGEYYRSHQSLGARSSEAATLSVLGLPLDHAQRQIAESAKVTPKQLREIARKYLNPENYYQVVVEP